ncbi:hypothetical protein QC823_03495 [Halomonas vilamensis]|uniref:Secreted protein n=1 Tax=Vreelandella vilamensis TaxID=531309 RepID=A0ABU1H169_9GAMM|nr:hypothetical protein [Halomonas vilamensis]MDR5898055.1 hypothetical protein [Halomonas vilamensis]
MPATLNATLSSSRSPRRYATARWWLAGLLVSCLLPVSLHPAEALRNGERSVCTYLWVPAVLRARSRRVALKRQWRHYFDAHFSVLRWAQPTSVIVHVRTVVVVFVAALDVQTRRGPPQAAA